MSKLREGVRKMFQQVQEQGLRGRAFKDQLAILDEVEDATTAVLSLIEQGKMLGKPVYVPIEHVLEMCIMLTNKITNQMVLIAQMHQEAGRPVEWGLASASEEKPAPTKEVVYTDTTLGMKKETKPWQN